MPPPGRGRRAPPGRAGVRVRAPATIGNFGPGFDACSLAVRGLGDTLTLAKARDDVLTLAGPAEGVPPEWERNAVGAVLDHLRAATGVLDRLAVHVRKGMPAGSGLGSSASSSGGAALAFHALYPKARLGPEDLVRAAAEGEARAAGRHYDDVAAVVMGGLALVQQRDDGLALARVDPPKGLWLAFLRPHIRLDTRTMRAVLPKQVDREDAVWNLGCVAMLVEAMQRGDIEGVGACLQDRIAQPARAPHVPGFGAVHAAALKAGAAGAGLSGSGPTLFAVCRGKAQAEQVARAMARAVQRAKVPASAFTAQPEREVMWRAVAVP